MIPATKKVGKPQVFLRRCRGRRGILPIALHIFFELMTPEGSPDIIQERAGGEGGPEEQPCQERDTKRTLF